VHELGAHEVSGSATSPLGDLAEGWASFLDGWLLLDMAIVLLLAMALGAVIAYHPLVRNKVSSVEELEQPKTLIMYAMVAAVVALLVKVRPEMALVVFGIGGLLRFRTDVGPAKDTGRVILVTVVGLCCGLKIHVVAVLATALGWLVILVLERNVAGEIQVKGIDNALMPRAAKVYRDVFAAEGCRVIRERKNFLKGRLELVITAPGRLPREALDKRFEELPEEIRGVVDWEIS
jgi:hypothetical protein